MKSLNFKIAIFSFFVLLLSCEKSDLNDDLGDTQKEEVNEEKNYRTVFPESIAFPENSTDPVPLNVSDENEIQEITTTSTAFEINKQDDNWYISPKEALDYEENSSLSISINVVDKFGYQEIKNVAVIITDEDESVPPDPSEESEFGSSKLPITISFYTPESKLYSTQSFQYDENNRQIAYYMDYVMIPEYNYYTLTSHSGNNSTEKSYLTQTNELQAYRVTTNSTSNKPITIKHYTADGSFTIGYTYQYDEQDRQIRIDYNTPGNPNSDTYTVTTYSDNSSTAKIYKTQTNEITSYTVTTHSISNKPITIKSYLADESLWTTITYQYDEQDRQIRVDYNTPRSSETDRYWLISYSDNTATAIFFDTQTNEFTGYMVTTYKD